MAENFSLSELVIPGTYVRVRAEGLISVGGISTGNIGIVGTASEGLGDITQRFERTLLPERWERQRVRPRASVFEDPLARLRGEVQAGRISVPLLEQVDHAKTLPVVIEAALVAHQLAENALSRVTERRVPEVVRERDRLGEVFVQPQRTRDRTSDLRAFERMREAIPVVVALVVDEHLRLVLETPKGA